MIPEPQRKIWARIGRLKMLVAIEKARHPNDDKVISGFRSEIIHLYEILLPTPELKEINDA